MSGSSRTASPGNKFTVVHACSRPPLPHGLIGRPGLTALGISQTPWTPPSAGLTYIGAFTVSPFVLRLHKPPQGSTSGELCSGQGHRCSSDCLRVFLYACSVPWCNSTLCPLGALTSPSQTFEWGCLGVGRDCPSQPLAVF